MSDFATTQNCASPVLILLHGATSNGHMWDPIRRYLDPAYRVLTPDLPGHGTRRDEPYTLEGAVAATVAAVRSVAPAPVILVGDSLGGYTSIASASALQKEQLIGLVIGGASFNFVGREVWPYVIKGAMFRGMSRLFGEQQLIRKSIFKELGPGKVGISHEDIQAMLDGGMSVRVFGQCVAALRGVDFQAKVAAISQPMLFVNGDQDKPNVRHEASFLAVAKNAQVHRFDCEHGVSIRRTREFAELVNAFARRASLGSAAAA
jgi:pimeloyl-ACP methyl ester carboxylesterase